MILDIIIWLTHLLEDLLDENGVKIDESDTPVLTYGPELIANLVKYNPEDAIFTADTYSYFALAMYELHDPLD